MAVYLWWRFTRSLIGVKHRIWAYTFLGAECIMAIGMIVGHSSRSFPVHRERVRLGHGSKSTIVSVETLYSTRLKTNGTTCAAKRPIVSGAEYIMAIGMIFGHSSLPLREGVRLRVGYGSKTVFFVVTSYSSLRKDE